ncbi:hypothetical protein HK097_008975 [Rhizophlyctis rosea]|uniref:Uncharacterized protein n=1 Tax=Rhizophlyctis rosea TaxID=64517 RepID=A0AAD5SBW1_9FUNG|nr:hypothetical protein HK097_008975 [Rhizophlyctis rosea]
MSSSKMSTPQHSATPRSHQVAILQKDIDDFIRRLDAGEECFPFNRFGDRSRIYRLDGKLYDTNRGDVNYDREIVAMDGPSEPRTWITKWGRLNMKCGPPVASLKLGDLTFHKFEKDGESEFYGCGPSGVGSL